MLRVIIYTSLCLAIAAVSSAAQAQSFGTTYLIGAAAESALKNGSSKYEAQKAKYKDEKTVVLKCAEQTLDQNRGTMKNK